MWNLGLDSGTEKGDKWKNLVNQERQELVNSSVPVLITCLTNVAWLCTLGEAGKRVYGNS